MAIPRPLSGGRLAALLIGVPVALALIGWGALNIVALAAASSISVNRSVAATGTTVSVDIAGGDLQLSPSPDRLVHVKGVVDYKLLRPAVSVSSSASGTSIGLSCQPIVVDQCWANLDIEVPAREAANASVVSGSISASDLDNLSLSSVSGSLLVSQASGVVDLSTTSGQITALAMGPAYVTVNAVSGSVSLAFAQAPARVSVQVTSGSVVVAVPTQGQTYAVEARSTSGGTSIGVPTDPTSSHVISISTTSGSISVEPGG
ncbi:MAG TPA: DUF4097 family beta strand repeat-containing protein [Candidatus Binatia bacterium]|nr:DUF4097 family beta strand repeat-containing protein [Candidatus Binatia bacterium]